MAERRNGEKKQNGAGKSKTGAGKPAAGAAKPPKLSPQQLAVVIGLLTNALSVESVLLDKDQTIQIVLEGSIRKKTKADRVAAALDDVSVGELFAALLRRQ